MGVYPEATKKRSTVNQTAVSKLGLDGGRRIGNASSGLMKVTGKAVLVLVVM